MAHYTVDGIVLRTYALGETDRIIHILSPNRGKVRGVAKGVRRPGSRFGGRLEPYSHVTVQLYQGRTLDTVTQAEQISANEGVRLDWAASACAATMAEACDRLAQEDERATSMFLLLKDALAVLAAHPERPAAVLDAFLMRLAVLEGVRPTLERCVTCRSEEALVAFHVAAGGLLCAQHAPAELQRIGTDTRGALHALVDAPWADLASGRVAIPRRVGALVRSYLAHHLHTDLTAWGAVPR